MNAKILIFSVLLFVPSSVFATPIVLSDLPTEISSGEYLYQVDPGETVTLSGSLKISGGASLHVKNFGTIILDGFSTETYGGNLLWRNYGLLTGDSWFVKDQEDNTTIGNYRNFSLQYLTMVANGHLGVINFFGAYSANVDHLVLDANYGGTINIDLIVSSGLSVETLNMDASGASHGQASSINIIHGEIDVREVPEPGSVFMFAVGLFAFFARKRRFF